MQEFVVARAEAGGRFDKYLKRLLPLASSGFLYRMLRKKNITLNDKKAEGKEILAEKDVVKLFFSEETFLKFTGRSESVSISGRNRTDEGNKDFVKKPPKDCRKAYQQLGEIPVIYEDEDILILNKPVGALSQKAKKEDVSLNEWMIGYLLEKKEISEEGLSRFCPSVCNRLDRNTSGLLLCGKTLRGSRFLSEVLRDRSLHKYYLTYAEGKIEYPITLRGYLKKEAEKNRSKVISEEVYRKRVLTAESERNQKKVLVAEPERNQEKVLTEKPERNQKKVLTAEPGESQKRVLTAGAEGYRKKASAPTGGEKEHPKEYQKEYHRIETVIKPLFYSEGMDCTKLEILLVTGKSHQIRAHLSEIGHPVLGDIKYGWKPKRKEEMGLKHQLLHAYRVEFPKREGEFAYLSGKAVTAPLPELFEKLEKRFMGR